MQMRERANNRGGRTGRGRGRGRGNNSTRTERNVNAVTSDEHPDEDMTTITDSARSNDHGGCNGQGFGRGAYGGSRSS
jgi:hypothetical protein